MKEFGVFKIANGFANVCVFEGTESECKAYAAAHPIPTDDKNGYIICPNPDNPPIRNVFVAMDNGESLLIYTRTLTNRECKELTEVMQQATRLRTFTPYGTMNCSFTISTGAYGRTRQRRRRKPAKS